MCILGGATNIQTMTTRMHKVLVMIEQIVVKMCGKPECPIASRIIPFTLK